MTGNLPADCPICGASASMRSRSAEFRLNGGPPAVETVKYLCGFWHRRQPWEPVYQYISCEKEEPEG